MVFCMMIISGFEIGGKVKGVFSNGCHSGMSQPIPKGSQPVPQFRELKNWGFLCISLSSDCPIGCIIGQKTNELNV
jgi:hypothetical protein